MKNTTIKNLFQLCMLLSFFAKLNNVYGQNKIIGKVLSIDGVPMEFVNVTIYKDDTVLVVGGITDYEGNYKFEKVKDGDYNIKFSAMGYEVFLSKKITLGEKITYSVPVIYLREQSNLLNSVDVRTTKSQIKNEADKTIINFNERNTSASLSILDVLKKVPKVTINEANNELAIEGKYNIAIAINGREVRIPQETILQFLTTINSKDILSIELISNPTSQYGGGTSAVLNIVLRRKTEVGINSNIFLGGGYGLRGKIDLGASLNAVYGKSNILVSINEKINNTRETYTFDRLTKFNNESVAISTVSLRTPTIKNRGVSILFDTQIKSYDLGLSFIGQRRLWNMRAENNTNYIINSLISNTVNLDNEVDKWNNILSNFYIHRRRENYQIDLDIDYLIYRNTNTHFYQNPTNDSLSFLQNVSSYKDTPIKIFASSLNYINRKNKNYSYSFGVKFSNSFLKNIVTFNDDYTKSLEQISNLSQNVSRQEKTYAAYGNIDFKKNIFNISAGLRYESFNADLYDYNKSKNIICTNTVNLLPDLKIVLSKKDYEVALLYNMRVERPRFQDLSPFIVFIGPYNYYDGNVNINSSIINTFKLAYTKKSDNISFQYSIFKNPIFQFQNIIIQGNIEVIKPLNFDQALISDISYSKNLKYKKFDLDLFASSKYQHLQNDIDGQMVLYKRLSSKVGVNVSYITKGGVLLNLSSYYQSPYYFGMLLRSSPSQTDILIKKTFFQKATVSFNINDIFKTNIWKFEPNWKGVSDTREKNYIFAENRFFKLNVSYDLGKKINSINNAKHSEERKRLE